MKTIHITSQDDLPDVAEAVIEALGRRTGSRLPRRNGRRKNDADPRNRRAAGRDGHRNQPHVRHRQPVQGARAAAASTISTSTASTTSAKLTTSATKSISIRATSVWSNGPKKIEQLLPDNAMTVRITVDSDTARTFEID